MDKGNYEHPHKLVRDKIPELIEKGGGIPEFFELDKEQFSQALKEKLVEEVQELLEAETKEELLDELADILQLVESITADSKLLMSDVENRKERKKKENGAFEKRYFLEHITIPDNQ